MTTPGEVERVPIKVVPYYVQEPEPDLDSARTPQPEPEAEPVETPRRRTRLVGIGAAVLALATSVVTAAAVVTSSNGDFPVGTFLAYVAIGVSAVAVLVSLVAIVGGFGRRWGIGALVVGVLANPPVLLTVLNWAERLQTGA